MCRLSSAGRFERGRSGRFTAGAGEGTCDGSGEGGEMGTGCWKGRPKGGKVWEWVRSAERGRLMGSLRAQGMGGDGVGGDGLGEVEGLGDGTGDTDTAKWPLIPMLAGALVPSPSPPTSPKPSPPTPSPPMP